MIKQISLAVLALSLLSGCSSTKRGATITSADNSLALDFERNVGDRVFFDYDSSKVSKEGQEQLKKQSEWLRTHPRVKATIEGHCDERGTREYNLALGERRADAVRQHLINQGIDASRLETLSYGKERPAVVGSDESSWGQNRRGVTAIK